MLSILAVVLILLASQQGGEDGGDGPLNAIAAAAERTQGEPGGRATVWSVVTSPDQPEPLRIKGEMVFNGEGRTRVVMAFRNPESDRPAEMEVVGDGAVLYMRSEIFGSLPDGREWMSLDLASATGLDPTALVPGDGDPKAELALLEAVDSPVQKVGKEEVRGVATTHYRGTIGVAENVERFREEGAEDLAAYYEKEGSPVQIEAWIDSAGLVRRMRVVQTTPGGSGEGTSHVDMRMDFWDFGIDPPIDVPDSDDVFDMTDVARQEIEGSSGG